MTTAAPHDTHDCGHVRPETTGRRPSTFSDWHRRELPSWAWACDLDLVEIRAGRGIVAVGELAEVEGVLSETRVRAIARCKRLQLGTIRQTAAALGVAGLFVLHDGSMSQVAVLDVQGNTARLMDGDEFREFLEDL